MGGRTDRSRRWSSYGDYEGASRSCPCADGSRSQAVSLTERPCPQLGSSSLALSAIRDSVRTGVRVSTGGVRVSSTTSDQRGWWIRGRSGRWGRRRRRWSTCGRGPPRWRAGICPGWGCWPGTGRPRTWRCWPGRSRWWSSSWPAGCTPPAVAGSLPLVGPGAVLAARGWAAPACPPAGPGGGAGRRAPVPGGGVGGRDHHLGSCGCDRPQRRPAATRRAGRGGRGAGRVVGAVVPAGGGRGSWPG